MATRKIRIVEVTYPSPDRNYFVYVSQKSEFHFFRSKCMANRYAKYIAHDDDPVIYKEFLVD